MIFLWPSYLMDLTSLFPSHQWVALIFLRVLSLPNLEIPLSPCLERQVPQTTLPTQKLMRTYWIHHLVTTIKILLLWFILVGGKKSFKFLDMQIRELPVPSISLIAAFPAVNTDGKETSITLTLGYLWREERREGRIGRRKKVMRILQSTSEKRI